MLLCLTDLALRVSLNAVLLQEMIVKIHNRQMDLEDVMAHMCSSRVDSYLVHLLRAITANELWRKQDHYKTFIPGIDAYGSVCHHTLSTCHSLMLTLWCQHSQWALHGNGGKGGRQPDWHHLSVL